MSKSEYCIRMITKAEAAPLLKNYHYLTEISNGFKSGHNVGLFRITPHDWEDIPNILVGVCIFTGFPAPELAKGCFGLERNDQDGLWELSRLVLHPTDQKREHNLAGWFASRAMRSLRDVESVRAILSYADDQFHSGTVYKALGFDYYGLSAEKKDFWFEQDDGSYIKHVRGPVKGCKGKWFPRTQKHRFLKVFDPALQCRWTMA
jgi:hypothetical protein